MNPELTVEEQIDELVAQAVQVVERHPAYRFGQTVFNLAYIEFPEAADKLRGTDYDPYYDDSKVLEFMEELNALVRG